jgi:hypothetical protein
MGLEAPLRFDSLLPQLFLLAQTSLVLIHHHVLTDGWATATLALRVVSSRRHGRQLKGKKEIGKDLKALWFFSKRRGRVL